MQALISIWLIWPELIWQKQILLQIRLGLRENTSLMCDIFNYSGILGFLIESPPPPCVDSIPTKAIIKGVVDTGTITTMEYVNHNQCL